MTVADHVTSAADDNSAWALGAVLVAATKKLQQVGIETATLDARLLLQAATGIDHATLISDRQRLLNIAETKKFYQLIERRLSREPVHRIIGRKEFWGLQLDIPAAVLEPRADSECLVEAVLDWIDLNHSRSDQLRLADIGTGSGAIILALLHELPDATAIATDISIDALSAARGNAQRCDLERRISFHQGNYLAPLNENVDLIVSNPPYISTADIQTLAPEVRNFDPAIALDGGSDGLDAYRVLLAESAQWLNVGGRVFFEIGFDQAAAVKKLGMQYNWKDMEILKDYGGRDRVFSASC